MEVNKFLEIENHTLLYELVKTNINNSIGVDISDNKNYKKGLSDVMNSVYRNNKDKKNVSLNNLNKETLSKCIPFFT